MLPDRTRELQFVGGRRHNRYSASANRLEVRAFVGVQAAAYHRGVRDAKQRKRAEESFSSRR